ncbi:hydrophobin-251 [Coprinopsis cinerea AmutBmut pab1-1]|nr:hydrophobin-251 [Coprinopsis cinerea AmutBmut pab1-1]
MFARLSTALLALTLVTSAIAGSHHKSRVEAEQCNGGEIQCCYGVQDSKSLDNEVTKLLGHLKIDAKQVTGQVGVGCTALNALGAGGGSSW